MPGKPNRVPLAQSSTWDGMLLNPAVQSMQKQCMLNVLFPL